MLLCGFEKFDTFFVRIDILERLFLQIINSSPDKSKEVKLIPEMLNLLGCNKNNFIKLIQKMNYKAYEKNDEVYFKYSPSRNLKKNFKKTELSNSPFKILKNINFN